MEVQRMDTGYQPASALDLWDQLEVELAFLARLTAGIDRSDRDQVETLEERVRDLRMRLRAFGITPRFGVWN
jgi:hypothetical protein